MKTFVSKFRKLPAILFASCLLATFCSPTGFAAAVAATQDESIGRSFWQLHPGNQFLVKGTVSRTTRFHAPINPTRQLSHVDHFDLLYVVEDMDPAGRLTMSVRVIRSLREPDDADREGMAIAERRLGLLEDISTDHDRQSRRQHRHNRARRPEAFAAALGGLHPASNGFLNAACTPMLSPAGSQDRSCWLLIRNLFRKITSGHVPRSFHWDARLHSNSCRCQDSGPTSASER